jgi:hypothetical protein
LILSEEYRPYASRPPIHMKTSRNRIFLGLVLLMPLICFTCVKDKGDFSSPQNTIKTYYENYYDRNTVSKCFYPPASITGGLDKWWLEYNIHATKPSDKVGKSSSAGVVISSDAIEIVVEVTMNHPKKGNPKTKFWYLLQKVNGGWKIIEHSHISDKNYPAYD